MKLDFTHILTGLLVFSLAFLPAVIQHLPADSLATTILGGAYAGVIGLAAWLNTSPVPAAVASLKAGVRRVLGLAPVTVLLLLVVMLVAACNWTAAQKAQSVTNAEQTAEQAGEQFASCVLGQVLSGDIVVASIAVVCVPPLGTTVEAAVAREIAIFSGPPSDAGTSLGAGLGEGDRARILVALRSVK